MRKRKRWEWHEHGPPWWDEDHGEERGDYSGWRYGQDEMNRRHGPPAPPWPTHREHRAEWHASGRSLFLRFAVAFGLLALLGCGIMGLLGAMALLFLRSDTIHLPSPSPGEHPLRWLFLLIPLVFLLLLILRWVGSLTARRFTQPLSETMKAADALAEGDMSARVPVQGSGEFRHFARSFNRMAQALETADRQRRELLADVAHELRTPLTVIQGNLEGLRDGVYEATAEHMDLVLDETQKLGRLVDDLRLLTLAEAGQLPLDFQVLDARQLLADVRDAFACQASDADIAMEVQTFGSLPPFLADPQRIGQVLGNLVTNALRHTPAGGRVTLGAGPIPDGSGIRLWVADTGEGIAPEDLPRIFDRFWRGDPARSRETGAGSGLGLAIAKGLVEAHGGRIWAESDGVPGQGTTISCILPVQKPQP